ncbi:MAG: Uncharacterized protein XD43_0534 [Thermococcales archaeon 44_46]|jgi:hypothetical protein|uniref:hypothetical protein n=1 Tax=Thermococcus TaxID=2263 RepID=UPI00074A53E2|nr:MULTISPECIES: hypothetical protein [Thermococcus]KUJ99806.1 MAG: Uncharacterized protein XD43_0534 [Thermococcales archaeon 44_46]MDK2782581.1 hypothetical protein [Thermococcaceae archaeon]MCA6214091.1 hypothetical protein [Thermococcus bergensis]MPW39948.1 hypothetical protein [Thermococcus sp. 101 C5]HIH72068.1 hypothetical protein [Thermococcaceae archaeon]
MENNELINILQLLAKVEGEKPKLDDELINKVIEKILEYKLKVAVSGDGHLMISNPDSEVLPVLEALGIGAEEQELYLDEAMQRILKALGKMVFSETEPGDDIEKKIFEKFNVPELRVKVKLKRVYTLPIVDVIEFHPARMNVDGRELKYYLLRIEHLEDKGKKPTVLNFVMTRKDLEKLHSAIEEVLSSGDVDQES